MSNNRAASTKDDGRALLSWATFVTIVVLISAAIVVRVYATKFWQNSLPNEPATWGQTGDYIGGLINPIVGLATVLLIFISIQIQRAELRATTQQLDTANERAAKQNFEQSLFSWLANYQTLLNNVRDDDGRTGREALVRWHESRFSGESAWMRSTSAMGALAVMGAATPAQGLSFVLRDPQKPAHRKALDFVFLQAQTEFGSVSRKNRVGLDPIFRTLSRLFRWIDTSTNSPAERWHYVSLICAQMSWIEQVYMLHYALWSAPTWFGALANKYSLFHGVDTHDAPVVLIAGELTQRPPSSFTNALPGPKPWPLLPSAFEPEIARANLGLEQELT